MSEPTSNRFLEKPLCGLLALVILRSANSQVVEAPIRQSVAPKARRVHSAAGGLAARPQPSSMI
jgi:hypothetical protein